MLEIVNRIVEVKRNTEHVAVVLVVGGLRLLVFRRVYRFVVVFFVVDELLLEPRFLLELLFWISVLVDTVPLDIFSVEHTIRFVTLIILLPILLQLLFDSFF